MTAAATSNVSDYAAAVRAAVGVVPPEAAALLDGLDDHLAEVAAEGDVDLIATLGPPERYAAELRASAGIGPATTEPSLSNTSIGRTAPGEPGAFGEPGATDALGAPGELGPTAATEPRLSAPLLSPLRRRLAARALLGLVAVAAVVTVSRTLSPAIIAVTGLIAAGWLAVRRLVPVAELPTGWAARLPAIAGGAALFLAVLLGTRIGGDSRDSPGPIAGVPRIAATTAGGIILPDLRGMALSDAALELHNLGVSFSVVDLEPRLRAERLVVATEPAAGSAVGPGSFISLQVASSRYVPTTTGPQSTTAPTAPSTTTPQSTPSATTPSTSTPSTTPQSTPSTTPSTSTPSTPTTAAG